MALGKANLHLAMHEMSVPAGSFLDGSTLASSGLRKSYNLIVVGVRRDQQPGMAFNPGMEFPLSAHDILLLMGEPDQMDRLMADLGAAGPPPPQKKIKNFFVQSLPAHTYLLSDDQIGIGKQ